MDPVPTPPPTDRSGFDRADAATRHGRSASLHALHVVEYALSAPAPRRERTWLHRLKVAVDALADAVDHQIRNDDNSVGLLAEIALSEPDYVDAAIDVRNEQRALRIAIASLSEQLESGADFAIDPTNIRDHLAKLAQSYRRHQAREAELIHAALHIDVTDLPDPPPAGCRLSLRGVNVDLGGGDGPPRIDHDPRRPPMIDDADIPFDANEADVVEQHQPVTDGLEPDAGLPDELPTVDADPADALDQYRTIPDDDDNWPIEPTP